MTVKISVSGSKELRAALKALGPQIEAETSKAVIGTALEGQAEIKRRIQRGPASGRVYRKYNPFRTHRASAPGQAPMSDTGRLAGSVTFDMKSDLRAVVGSSLIYAVYLENGTRNMAARPVWRPVSEKMRVDLQRRLEAALAEAIR